jgi:hypothetical protein
MSTNREGGKDVWPCDAAPEHSRQRVGVPDWRCPAHLLNCGTLKIVSAMCQVFGRRYEDAYPPSGWQFASAGESVHGDDATWYTLNRSFTANLATPTDSPSPCEMSLNCQFLNVQFQAC